MLAVAISWAIFAVIVFVVYSAFHTPSAQAPPPLDPVELAPKKRRSSAKKGKTTTAPLISSSYMLEDDELDDEEIDDRLLALTPRSNTQGHMQLKRQRKATISPREKQRKLEPAEVEVGWEQVTAKPITPKRVALNQENANPNATTPKQQSAYAGGFDDWDDSDEYDWFSDQKAAGAAKHSKGKKSKQFKSVQKREYASEKRAAQKHRTH